jgi:DNA-binding MarR family transcriptional regulator
MQELLDTPGRRAGEIASRLAIHQTTSNLLDALEKRGYMMKARDSRNQRMVRLSLSESGQRLLAKALKPARGLLPESLRHLGSESLSQLGYDLQGLLESIGMLDEGFGLQPLPFTM